MTNTVAIHAGKIFRITESVPGFALSAIGLGFVTASMQSMRMTTLTGTYPVDWTLVARHVIAVAAVACVFALQSRSKGDERSHWGSSPLDSFGVVIGLSCTLSCVLLVKYLPSMLGVYAPVPHTVALLIEEGVGVALLLAWVRRLLPFGKDAAVSVFALSLIAQVAVQLIMSFLQSVPCMVAFALLPWGSLACYAAVRKSASDSARQEQEGAVASPAPVVVPFIFCVLALCILFSCLLSGLVLYESLDVQQEMAASPLMQLCIIFGSLIAAIPLIAFSPQLATRFGLPALLVIILFCQTVSLYLTLILTSSTVGFYLALSSVSSQLTHAVILIMPFTVAVSMAPSWKRLLIGMGALYLAKCFSSSAMLLEAGSPGLLEALSIVGVFALFACVCISLAGILVRPAAVVATAPAGCVGCGRHGVSLAAIDLDDGVCNAKTASFQDEAEEPAVSSSDKVNALTIGEEFVQCDVAEPLASDEETGSSAESASIGEQSGVAPGYSYRDAVAKVAREFNLTRREEDVLAYVARGKTASVIAADMFLSLNTVKSHMRNIYVKLDVHSQVEVVELVESYGEASML